MIRNLLFHCYPLKGPVWRWHANLVAKYRPVWNGRRILTIVLDHLTDSEEAVREAFLPLEAEIIVRPNHRSLHETAHFLEGLGRLESKRDDEATFYAHAKGVSQFRYPKDGVDIDGILRWCRALYELNLSRPELIDRILLTHSAAGAFRQRIHHAGSSWLYSGTFFWLKHSAIFSREWRDILDAREGVEGYPGRHLKIEDCFPLPPEEIDPRSLYTGFVNDERISSWKKELEAL